MPVGVLDDARRSSGIGIRGGTSSRHMRGLLARIGLVVRLGSRDALSLRFRGQLAAISKAQAVIASNLTTRFSPPTRTSRTCSVIASSQVVKYATGLTATKLAAEIVTNLDSAAFWLDMVANEVKELAKQTAKATEEIGHQIVTIQNGTAMSVEAIEGIAKVIDQIDSYATSIAAAVEEQSTTVQSIARNANEVSTGVGYVVENIKGVATAAAEAVKNAATSQEAARNVTRVSGQLESLFRK